MNIVEQIRQLEARRVSDIARYEQSIDNLVAKRNKYPGDEVVVEFVEREIARLQSEIAKLKG